MKNGFIGVKLGISAVLFFLTTILHAGAPVLTFTPLTPTTLTISPAMTKNVMYTVTNQSNKPHNFVLKALPAGISQVTTAGYCPNPIVLTGHQSCTLNLLIVGALLPGNVVGGPVACERGNAQQCYDPCANALNISTNTARFTVGGQVSGLNGTIELNLGDDFITLSADGPFTFPTFLFDGQSYEVTVQSEPSNQSCTPVINSDGTINGANVTNVAVNCVTSDFSVGVTVNGFTGGTLVLQNNGGDNLNIPGNGFFTFSNLLPQGAPYFVTVSTQPAGQTCSVSNPDGFIDDVNITNIVVTCNASTQTVGGNVAGFTGGNLVLQNNMGDNLTIVGNGAFNFATPVAEGSSYSVTVLTQPGLQNCVVTNGTGTVGNAPVNTVVVTCTSPPPTTISSSVNNLALSVKNTALDPTLTGKPRTITITNNGPNPTINLDVRAGMFPDGTSSSHNCPAVLNVAASCTITITPGVNATSTCTSSTIAPFPAFVSVHTDNSPYVSIEVLVLSYGCIYQQGYIYSVDDTTPASGNIGGKVVAIVDQAARGPGGKIWSSNNGGAYDGGVPIFAVNELSTTVSPSPSSGQVAGQTSCNGKTNGLCNSNNIFAYYTTLGGVGPTNYASGLCKNYNSGDANLNWYLPSFCEMGPSTMAAPFDCASNIANIVSNIPQLIAEPTNQSTSCLIGHDCLGGDYWSSTQSSFDSTNSAWYENFKITNGGSSHFTTTKSAALGVRCSRNF
jgi:hypothetical protein